MRDVQPSTDEQHLRALSICYYVLSSLSALSGCVLASFAMFGVAIMAGAMGDVPPEVAVFVGLIVVVLELALALLVWTMCALEFLTGRSLASRSRYGLCFVVSCIELMNFPFGTLLAVFTMIVLSRPSVRDLFAGIPAHDPRTAALAAFDDDEQPPPRDANDDGSMREGMPT